MVGVETPTPRMKRPPGPGEYRHDRGAEPQLRAGNRGRGYRHEGVAMEGLVGPRVGEAGVLGMAHEIGEMRILKAVEGNGDSKAHHGGQILPMVVG